VREFDEPLAPVQLMAYVQDAAASGHWLDWYARDALVRVLHRHLLAGWRCSGETDPQTADAGPDDPLLIAVFQEVSFDGCGWPAYMTSTTRGHEQLRPAVIRPRVRRLLAMGPLADSATVAKSRARLECWHQLIERSSRRVR
jgi:hypothetical protein